MNRAALFIAFLVLFLVLAITVLPAKAQIPCKGFVGINEVDRTCVFLPIIEQPPTPTPVPTPTASFSRTSFLKACADAKEDPLKIGVPAGNFEGLVTTDSGTGRTAWTRRSVVHRTTGREYRYVDTTNVVAHGGISSVAFGGIPWVNDKGAGVPVDQYDLLHLWSNALGLVSAPDKIRWLAAYKVGFWMWVERPSSPSGFDRLYVDLRGCTARSAEENQCEFALGIERTHMIPLSSYTPNQWHYVESTWDFKWTRRSAILASINFELAVDASMAGTSVYLDDVELDICGAEVAAGSTSRVFESALPRR